MVSKDELKMRRSRLTGRVIGFLASGMMLFMLIGSFIEEVTDSGEPLELAGILIALLGITGLAATILSYKNLKISSILIALVGLGIGAHIAAYAGRNHFVVWLVTGFPFIISAILFYYSYKVSARL